MLDKAGIKPHTGKTKCWAAGGGPAPPGFAELGDGRAPVWKGDLPAALRGVDVLGAPLGTPESVQARLRKRAMEEDTFLNELPHLEEGQAGWSLLTFRGATRANYILRTTPQHLQLRTPRSTIAM